MKPKGFPDASCLGTAKIPIYALVQKVKVTARLSVVRFERLPSLNPKAVSMVQSAAVLLVDDSIGDVELAREVWRESAVPTQLYVTSNGEEAIRFLRRQAICPHASSPISSPRSQSAIPKWPRRIAGNQARPYAASHPGCRVFYFIYTAGYCQGIRQLCQRVCCQTDGTVGLYRSFDKSSIVLARCKYCTGTKSYLIKQHKLNPIFSISPLTAGQIENATKQGV